MNFAAQEYGWTVDYVVDCPLVMLMLLMRERIYSQNKTGMTLQDKERIDEVASDEDWNRLVAENHARLAKQFSRNR